MVSLGLRAVEEEGEEARQVVVEVVAGVVVGVEEEARGKQLLLLIRITAYIVVFTTGNKVAGSESRPELWLPVSATIDRCQSSRCNFKSICRYQRFGTQIGDLILATRDYEGVSIEQFEMDRLISSPR